ncbi:hypothetical protein RUM44_011241 [Polyplax serrata]|uniref:peptidylprolyl isomerase n=1 Tax=Polyplax serrata TaxID=468196 RepID=A0ABR1APG2_POLSC
MPTGHLNGDTNVAESSSVPVNTRTTSNIPGTILDDGQVEGQTKEKDENPAGRKDGTEEWTDVLGSGDLKMKTIKDGEPDTRPQMNDVCAIRMLGRLDDGTIVEDFNSLKIQLGSHEVVQGVELAVPLMNVGEEAVIIVAARFGYGSIGNPPKIPPNSRITYEVTLIDASPEPCLEQIPFDERKALGNSKKERGNWWYARQDPTKAIQCYRKALDILDETVAFSKDEGENSIEYTEEQMKDVIDQKLVIYNNMAAAQLMIEAYVSALMYVNRVLQCDKKNVKALFRKGKILSAKGHIDEAVEVLREAFLLEPENSAIKLELSKCVKSQKTEKQHEKILCRKMFGNKKNDEKSTENSKKKKRAWTKMLGTAASASIMAAVAFAVCYKFKNYSFL